MENLIRMDIGERTEAFGVFASQKGRLAAAVRAFMEKRRSSRAKTGTCSCTDSSCQTC